jgi:tetratricopeptide (TPR) repeat protein
MHALPDIRSTRKAGNLSQALAMAEENRAHFPDDIYLLREMGWTHYGFLKEAESTQDLEKFQRHLDQLLQLGLDLGGEGLLGNQVAWKVYGLVKDWDEHQAPEIVLLLEKMRSFTFDREKDGVPAVLMLRLALKVKQRYPQLLEFLEWWDLARMPEKEYEKFVPERGKPIMSLAEQAHNAYAKALLDRLRHNPGEAREKITAYLPQLAALIEQHPDYEYPPYRRAQLLIAIGQGEEALVQMRQFVKQHQRLYWPWATLGRIYRELGQSEQARICLGKAVTLERDETFLVRVRPQLAELLLTADQPAAAKREVLTTLDTLGAHGYKVPALVSRMQEAEWFQSVEATSDNRKLYRDLSRQADDLLFADVPEEVGVVTGIDPGKGRVFVMVHKEKTGFFKPPQAKQWQPGQAVALRMEEKEGKNGTYHQVVTYAQTEAQPSSAICKSFAGELYQPAGKPFGFVGKGEQGVFVPAFLLQDVGSGAYVQGKAVLSYDKKKGRWGWQGVSLQSG